MEEVCLHIENEVFRARKDVLCEHSDYFRAMFSGNYVENEQKQIKIDVVDSNSMKIILQYMNIGLIDLSEHSLTTIGELAVAANFLQIIELIKQIEYCLDLQLSLANWVQTMAIAENSCYSKLEQLSAAFGLLSFKRMKPEYIPSIQKLYWYLSHPYLDASNELDVFKFGLQWISSNETGADALILILCCLDMKRLTATELEEMKTLVSQFSNSLASKVIEFLHVIASDDYELSPPVMENQKPALCAIFTERVYNETLNILRESRSRQLRYVPAVPVWMVKDTKPEVIPHEMYTFNEDNGFERWIEVADKNLWGWNIVTWGATKLVVVCGEHGRGTGSFMKDVKVYDTLRKEWICHGVQLPSRRHGGVAILDDSLFIIGGVGGFRVVLDTATVYDLREKSHRNIAKFPDTIQNPGVCVHNNQVYGAGQKNIYRYEDLGESDRWVTVIAAEVRVNCMISFKNYIYCTQNYFNHLYRFRPDIDTELEMVTYFSNAPATICHLDNRLIVFTRTMCGRSDRLAVEEYTGNLRDERPRVMWFSEHSVMKVNDVAGSATLVMNIPPLNPPSSPYHKRYLARYDIDV